ncbi:hypothetical protein [Ehrlichia canis]|uniref:hypothetical protein n=1 Tax=Ehrlichia canis TaxID=944 RepID=UPI000C85C172|nr:hypothetical protein [Ehrlichia canis]AUO55120.1 hypothetical protein C1I72_04645 [Ehrlichia canis]UKC53083.1 hypothetical protein s20019040002_000125 [Ehrlichia canis]UKC54020.1 hypothetical protein s20026770001_000125 [Ehrlichia canis]UKC54956.1 hypothetical protein s21009500007_000125 [Ehrlichia canis]
MPNNNDYDTYSKFIRDIRSTVFYIRNRGVLHLGDLVSNVTPATYIIDSAKEGIREQFLSRVFVHHSNNKNDIKKVIDFIISLGFIPVVNADYKVTEHEGVCIYDKNRKYGDKHVLIVSSVVRHTTRDVRNIILESRKNFRSSFDDGAKDSIRTVLYDPDSKPLKQRIYDAISYSEKWSLLTTQEKVIRCIFTVLSLSIPLIPPLLLLSYIGNIDIREAAYSMNLLPWQYRVYMKTSDSLYDVIVNNSDEERRKMITDNIMETAMAKGFVVKGEGDEIQPTDLGKHVSGKHNLLLVAHNKELSKKQLLLRITTFSVLAFVCFSQIIALTCHLVRAEKIALYCSILSYFVIFVEGLYLLSLKTTMSKVCATFCLVFAGFMLMVHAFLLYNDITFGYGPIMSGLMVIITGAVLSVALACNQYYKQDRDLALKLGGISTTAYLSMKRDIDGIDEVKTVKLEGGCGYQIIDDLSLALFNAYNAGVFGTVQDQTVGNRQDEIYSGTQENDNCPNISIGDLQSIDRSNSQDLNL